MLECELEYENEDVAMAIVTIENNNDILMKAIEEAGTLKNQRTGFSPQKRKSRSFALPYPKPKKMVLNEKEVENITATQTGYHKGLWGYHDYGATHSYVIVDADNPIYDQLVQEFIALHPTIKTEIEFFNASILFLRKKILELKILSYFEDDEEGLVCRHYATFILPFYAKLMDNNNSVYAGKIYQLSVEKVNFQFKPQSGHVFIVVEIKTARKSEFWFLDVYNSAFANLSSAKTVEKLFDVGKNGSSAKALDLRSLPKFADWIRTAQERFDVQGLGKSSIYENPEKLAIATKKFLIHAIASPDELNDTYKSELYFDFTQTGCSEKDVVSDCL